MNFLSHFYFDRDTSSANIVLGTVLPDLIKNANKNWNAHPQKKTELFEQQPALNNFLIGWKRHLQVDLIFHSSNFFNEKTQQLKQLLLPILSNSAVRPSFLAHIALELLLDHLLIEKRLIKVDHFYEKLDVVDAKELSDFLNKCELAPVETFQKFFNSFKSSRYLLSYQKTENISYALQRICMRLWEHPFNEETTHKLTSVLEIYKTQLEVDFMVIFEEIENRLT